MSHTSGLYAEDPRITADPSLRGVVADHFDLEGHRCLRDLHLFIEAQKQLPEISLYIKMITVAPESAKIVNTLLTDAVNKDRDAAINQLKGTALLQGAAHLREQPSDDEVADLNTAHLNTIAQSIGISVQKLLTPLTPEEQGELDELTIIVETNFGSL